ncbi:preprotein translocase subunit Tim44 [beta proteobacterium AAP121]|nr:preprotein translocase subunit Tim44 [beta proteobacterium AAP65]KPF93205.1 preprotein translocase subunit Tim44 [beta proteobacterium AAP121]
MLNRLRRLENAVRWPRARVARREARARQLQIEELLQVARLSFLRLQLAWDTADLGALGELATRQLLDELRDQLAQRGPEPNRTEVLQLQARLLSLDDLHEAMLASVEFTGLIREQQSHEAAPFRELWMLASVKAAGPGWKLARVQSLS